MDRRRVNDSELSHRDIRELSRNIHGDHNTRRAVEEIINSAKRAGDIDRDRIHEGIQKKIATGEFTRQKGESIAKELGLESKRFRYFEDESEYNERHPDKNNYHEESNNSVFSSNGPKESSGNLENSEA